MTERTDGPWVIFVDRISSGAEVYSVMPAGRRGNVAIGIDNSADADLIAAAPDLFEAALRLEMAELAHLNCEECEGEEIPELCPTCFPLYDDARVLRRNAIERARGRTADCESGDQK